MFNNRFKLHYLPKSSPKRNESSDWLQKKTHAFRSILSYSALFPVLSLVSPYEIPSNAVLLFPKTSPGLYVSAEKSSVGNGEIARIEQFLHFPRCLLPIRRTFYHFIKFTYPFGELSVHFYEI